MEERILLGIQELRTPFWDVVFGSISELWVVLGVGIGIALVLMAIPKTRSCGVAVAISMILDGIITNLILKNLVNRIRPYELIEGLRIIGEKQSDASFPSGHTGFVFAFGAVILFYGIFVKDERRRMPLSFGIAATVFAVAVAFSRLYVGVHYPSDVIAGIAVGLITSATAYLLTEKLIYPKLAGTGLFPSADFVI